MRYISTLYPSILDKLSTAIFNDKGIYVFSTNERLGESLSHLFWLAQNFTFCLIDISLSLMHDKYNTICLVMSCHVLYPKCTVLTGGAPSQNSSTARPIKLPYKNRPHLLPFHSVLNAKNSNVL